MRLEQMRNLLALASAESISQAAQSLFISHQGLSREIKALEAELGVRLFNRSYNGIKLTSEGEIVKSYCERFVALYDEMQYELGGFANSPRDAVIPEFLGTQHTMASLYDYVNASRFDMALQRPLTELLALTKKKGDNLFALDLVFDRSPLSISLPGCAFTPVYITKPGICVSRAQHPNFDTSVTPESIATEPLVVFEDATVDTIVGLVFDGTNPNIIAKTTNGAVFRRLISEGKCVGLFDSLTFEKYHREITDHEAYKFVPLATECTIIVGFAYREDSKMANLLQQSIDDAVEKFNMAFPKYGEEYPLEV